MSHAPESRVPPAAAAAAAAAAAVPAPMPSLAAQLRALLPHGALTRTRVFVALPTPRTPRAAAESLAEAALTRIRSSLVPPTGHVVCCPVAVLEALASLAAELEQRRGPQSAERVLRLAGVSPVTLEDRSWDPTWWDGLPEDGVQPVTLSFFAALPEAEACAAARRLAAWLAPRVPQAPEVYRFSNRVSAVAADLTRAQARAALIAFEGLSRIERNPLVVMT